MRLPYSYTLLWQAVAKLCLVNLSRYVAGVIIDPESSVYPYQQLAAQLREQIADGTITNKLPSLTTLVSKTGLSLGTVQRAIKVLVDEGLVFKVRGRGVFVRKD